MKMTIMIVAIILFLVIVLGAPFLIEHLFKTSTLFKAEDAYDVEYDGKYLTFKTDTKKGEINWKFKGDCLCFWFQYIMFCPRSLRPVGSAPPGAPCGRVGNPAPASDGCAVLAWVDDGVQRYITTVTSFAVSNYIHVFFFIRCDSVRSTPGGCFPQTPLSATNRLFTYTRAVLRNLFRRPCALLYERAGLRSVAPRKGFRSP